MSPIATYLDELAGMLRRGRRRRIVAEVRAHLLDAAAARAASGEDADAAQRLAVARFGSPAEVARAFNALRPRRRPLLRRLAAVGLTMAATASLGTATVWALQPGASSAARATVHAVHAHPARHHRAGRDRRDAR